jgi:threonine synthase
MSVWRWAEWISDVPPAARFSLDEGHTPLVRSRRMGPAAGLENLYFKLESSNPSGSYKDRFAAVAISHLLARGKRRCVATSSGNTGSALAAYCAAAGIPCEIALVELAPEAKLQQMLAYGARLFRVRGFGIDAALTERSFSTLRRWGQAPGNELLISAFSFCPEGMSGVQTISYELAEQIPDQPINHVFCPAGGGGLTVAVARGFEILGKNGRLAKAPAIECVQPAGNDTIATPLREGADRGRAVQCTSAISGLQVPSLIDGNEVIAACRRSGGTGHVVSDTEVWDCQKRMALEEGIFCEPAAAVALAGALKAVGEKRVGPDATIVCLVTSSGFKDAVSIERMLKDSVCPTIELADLERRVADEAKSSG